MFYNSFAENIIPKSAMIRYLGWIEKPMNEIKRLVDKSVEAFILGLEVYNKPTVKYRVEGFSFFIVNAWELMLKAEMIKRNINIYYKDSDRTLSVTDAVKKIYPDKNTRIRLNLEKIIELRNISTHFITEDYEDKYVPLFQACVINYTNEIIYAEIKKNPSHFVESLRKSKKITPGT